MREYHVYSNTVSWKPYVGQKITFKREYNNPYNKFAVAGKVTVKEKAGLIAVGHVLRELSRYIWFSIGEGPKFEAEVYKEIPIASSLVQGDLEIPLKVSVMWDEVAKVKEVEYPLTGEYVDDSKNILQELGIEEDDHVEFQTKIDDNEDIQML